MGDRLRKARVPIALGGLAVAVEAVALKRRSGRIAGNVVVRCQEGHLFTTIWIPGASVKSLRFAAWRFQRCPVGHHWSVVTPVRASDLALEARELAAATTDVRVP